MSSKNITGSLPDKAEPLSLDQYIIEVNRVLETTSSILSDITTEMLKTEAMGPELTEIGRRRFNFPWCTGYSPNIYRKGLDLLIHK